MLESLFWVQVILVRDEGVLGRDGSARVTQNMFKAHQHRWATRFAAGLAAELLLLPPEC